MIPQATESCAVELLDATKIFGANGQRTLAYTTGLIAAYGGLVGNVFGAISDLPGPASNPGVAPPMPQAGVFYAILAIIVPCLLISFGLVLYGMRGAATERSLYGSHS